MRKFLTEFKTRDGYTWCGDDVYAISWKEAEYIAGIMNLTVVGEWIEDVDDQSGIRTINPMYN